MIYVLLKDGTRRTLGEAKSVKLVWEDTEVVDGEEKQVEREYDLADVAKIVMFAPTLYAKEALLGGTPDGPPIVQVAFRDEGGLAVEIPLPAFPAEYLEEFTGELLRMAENARKASGRAGAIQADSEVAVAQSLADVARQFGGPPKKLNGAA